MSSVKRRSRQEVLLTLGRGIIKPSPLPAASAPVIKEHLYSTTDTHANAKMAVVQALHVPTGGSAQLAVNRQRANLAFWRLRTRRRRKRESLRATPVIGGAMLAGSWNGSMPGDRQSTAQQPGSLRSARRRRAWFNVDVGDVERR
ncbi:hypothetical protein MRX96_014789 [Rhipicephalus microplus]